MALSAYGRAARCGRARAFGRNDHLVGVVGASHRLCVRPRPCRRRGRRSGRGPAAEHSGVRGCLSRDRAPRRGDDDDPHALSRQRVRSPAAPQPRTGHHLPQRGQRVVACSDRRRAPGIDFDAEGGDRAGRAGAGSPCLLGSAGFASRCDPRPPGTLGRRPFPAALHFGHHGFAKGRAAQLSHVAVERPPRGARTWHHCG